MKSDSRRTFLKQLGIASISSLALPFVQPVLANTSIRRVIFVYIPDGMNPSDWHPQGTETNFTLPSMTRPLERVKDECIFLNGIDMQGPGSTHEGGVLKLLTGTSGRYSDRNVSLDYYLGQQFKHLTLKPHLNLNIVPKYHDKHITFDFNKTPVAAEKNPLAAFNALFSTDQQNNYQANARRLSVLDQVYAEVNGLKSKLGMAERAKLDTHLDSIRELEQRLSADVSHCQRWNFNPTRFQVTRTGLWDNPEYLDNTQMSLLGDLHTDVAIHALACDMTRVVTLKWNNSVNDLNIPESGSSMTCHGASHAGGNEFVKIKAWYVERFAQLIEQLKNYPDGTGSLLDSTLVFLGSDLAHGSLHNHRGMPFILAGGQLGGMKTGRYLNYSGVAHNKLLVSIAQYMGVPIHQFGTEDNTPSLLPNLLVS